MNNIQHQEAVKEAVKQKFHGHPTLKCRTIPRYPETAEREFKRIMNAYVKIMNAELKARLPELMLAYKKERHDDARYDDLHDLERELRRVFREIAVAVEQKVAQFKLNERITSIATMTEGNALREWKRAVHNTLGIDLLSDYYNGSFYAEYIKRWVDENVLKIKSIPNDMTDRMREIIMNGYRSGMTIRDIQREIQGEYDVTKSKARMLARDQLATLNAQIAEAQMRDAGVTRYRWSTSGDSRVRECHAALDGRVFSFDDPPEMWYDTKSRGRVYTGRRANPGEDYCCRCVAIPVFEFDKLDIPMQGEQK